MKALKYILASIAIGCAMVSCDTDVENTVIQKPKTYSEQYYKNLRDYKKSDHEISFMWFAQWSGQNSMAVRFNGLPDSLDICSALYGVVVYRPKRILSCGRIYALHNVSREPRCCMWLLYDLALRTIRILSSRSLMRAWLCLKAKNVRL